MENLTSDDADTKAAYQVYEKLMIATCSFASVVITFGLWTLKTGFKSNVKLVKQITILLVCSIVSHTSNTITYYYLLKKCNN